MRVGAALLVTILVVWGGVILTVFTLLTFVLVRTATVHQLIQSALVAVTKISADTETNPNVLRLVIKYIALKKFAGQNPKLQDHLANVFDLVNLRGEAIDAVLFT